MDLSDKYVFCKQVNITSSMLYGDATLLPHPDVVKNGLLLELYEIQRCGSVSWAVYGSWAESLLNLDSISSPTKGSSPSFLASESAEQVR